VGWGEFYNMPRDDTRAHFAGILLLIGIAPALIPFSLFWIVLAILWLVVRGIDRVTRKLARKGLLGVMTILGVAAFTVGNVLQFMATYN
jgi:hypothetical protein